MKRGIKQFKKFLCYFIVTCMLASSLEPMSRVYAAEPIGLSFSKASMLVGDKKQVSLNGDTIKSVVSKNKKVAKVRKDGTIIAKKAGKTTIIVTGTNGKEYSCTVKVRIGLSKKRINISKGRTAQIKLCGAKIKKVYSKNKKIANAKKKGKYKVSIMAKKKGIAKIKVVGKNKKTYTCKVTVENPSINIQKVVLAKGDKSSLKIKNTKQKITWSSENDEIASVDEKGVVTAKAAGVVTISAIDESGKTYTCEIKVEEPVMGAKELYMDVDQKAALTLAGTSQHITWSTSDKNIASVDEKGLVTAKAAGVATISAKVESGATYSCKVTVVNGKSNKPVDEKSTEIETPTTDDNGAEVGEGDPENKDDQGQGGEGDKEKEFHVSFVDNEGGCTLEPVVVKEGTTIESLPKPSYKETRTFLGWFYDSEFMMKALDDDVIETTLILYAKSELVLGKTPEDVIKTTAVKDASPFYTLTVKSTDKSLTKEQVLNQIEVTNVTHSGSEDYEIKDNNISISGENGTYILSGKQIVLGEVTDGFEDGASYIIKLPDADENGNATLSFEGKPNSVREFDVNVAAKEKKSMTIGSDVIMIPTTNLDTLADAEGNKLDNIDSMLYSVDSEGNVTENENGLNGYFVFKDGKEEKIEAGTTVAIYSGMDPVEAMSNPEKFDEGENHIAYVFITKVEDDKYYFGNAEISDIIRMPEILPIPAGSDLEIDDLDNTREIPLSELDWSDDKFADIKLDSKTTLDEGDFITFYKGTYGTDDMQRVGGYEEVTKILRTGITKDAVGDDCEYIVFETKAASLSDIADSGETSYSNPINIMDELSPEQIQKIEKQSLNDAKKSGFVEEAGKYLAKTALATKRFKDIKGIEKLKDKDIVVKGDIGGDDDDGEEDDEDGNDDLGDVIEKSEDFYDKYKDYSDKYKEMLETYKQFGLGGDDDDDDGAVEVSLEDIDVSVGSADQLPGGIGVHLYVKFQIEVTVPSFGGGDDEDGKEEGKEDGKEDGKDKDDKDDKDKDDKDKDDKDKDDKDKDDKDEEAEEENKLTIEVEADFVQEIQLDMGFDASIEWNTSYLVPFPEDVVFSPSFTTGTYTGIDVNALVYTAGQDDGMGVVADDVKEMYSDISEELKSLMDSDEVEDADEAEEVTSWIALRYKQMLEQEHDAITLVEKTLFEAKYELFPGIVEFGLEVKFVVTVDVVVSLGIEFSNIQCKKTVYAIHVLKGKCDTNTVEIIPAELDFKFYVMGTLELKVGFEVELSLQLVEGYLGQASLTVALGAYLDMCGFFYYHINIKDGKKKENAAGALFVEVGIYIELGAGASVGKNTKLVKGKLYSWDTTLFEKKFPLKSWGENEVPLDFNTLQEDMPDVSLRQYVTKFKVPDAWYEINTLTLDEGDFSAVTYDDDSYGVELTNKWFEYVPEEHIIQLKDGYEGMEAETDATFYYKNGAIPLSYAKMTRTIHITWDNYLDGYAITPNTNGGSYVEAIVGKIGTEIRKPKDPTKKGYVFDGWYLSDGTSYEFPETMPDKNVDIYAHWKPATDTPYTVYYYLENPDMDGEYILDGKKVYRGTTDTTVTPEVLAPGAYKKSIEGEEEKYAKYDTPQSSEVTILPSGAAVLRYYYDISRSKTTFKTGDKGLLGDVTLTTKYGDPIFAPEYSAYGYEFTGWKDEKTGKVVNLDEIISNNENSEDKDKNGIAGAIKKADGKDITYIAQWQPRTNILYRVEYYVQQLSGAYTVQSITYGQGKAGDAITEDAVRNQTMKFNMVDEYGTESEKVGTADQLFTQKDGDEDVIFYDGMKTDGAPVSESNPAEIKADGSRVVKVYYSRKMRTVKLTTNGTDESPVYGDYDVCYGGKIALPIPVKEGYTFPGFKDANEDYLDSILVDASGNDVFVNEENGFVVVTVKNDVTYTTDGLMANSYKVTYDANGGMLTGNASQVLTFDEKANLYDAPTAASDDVEFAGWKDYASGKTYQAKEEVINLTSLANAEITLVAQWKSKAYSVTYNLDGGTIEEGANPDTYYSDKPAKALAYPVKLGYTFEGWFSGDEKVVSLSGGRKGDLNLVAKWSPIEGVHYVVNHYTQDIGGEGRTLYATESFTGETGDEVTPSVKNIEGFNSPSEKTVTINGDGSSSVDYVYTRKQYKLTLNLDGGSISGKDTVEINLYYGENIDVTTPQKDGFVFAGWLNDGEKYTDSVMPNGNLTLKAAWANAEGSIIVNHYKQDTNGEYTILADREVVTGNAYDEYTPVVKNYEHFGKPANVETVAFAEGSVVSVDVRYPRDKYKLTWNLNGGSATNDYTSGTVFYGQAIVVPVMERDNYSYVWDNTPEGTMGAKDVTYSAIWTAKQTKVAFDTMDGIVEGELERIVNVGDKYGELPTPTKVNAEFLGWYDKAEGGNKVTKDTVVSNASNHLLYARWKYVQTGITYEGINDTDVNDNPTTVELGKETIIKAPQRLGYKFLGWSDGKSDKLYMEYVIAADADPDIVLTANWESIKYALQLYSYSGLYLVKYFEYGEDLTQIALPKNEGYRFTGWKDVNSGEIIDSLPETMPEKELTYVAQWEKIEYRIIFENLYGAKVDEIRWTVEDNNFEVQPPTTNRYGYDFGGWYKTSAYNEEDRVERMKPVANNVRLYARWIPRKYKINLYYNGGKDSKGLEFNTDKDNIFTFDETKSLKTISSLGLYRNGYTFEGWSKTQGGDVAFEDGYTFTSGYNELYNGEEIVNLYAVWRLITYSITYKSVLVGADVDENGTSNPIAYSVESEDWTLKVPREIKEGYQFLGWSDASGELIESGTLKLKGEVGNKTLTAQWRYAGTYSIALKSSSAQTPTGDGTSVFKITRTIPTGVKVTDDPQRVYYRTVNGTAIGGTVEVVGAAGEEKGKTSANNFYHVGGENTYAFFDGMNECYSLESNEKHMGTIDSATGNAEVEFTVKREKASIRYYGHETPADRNGIYAHLYNLNGTNTRYYTAEIYRIESARGAVTGLYGTKEAKRTMTMPTNKLLTDSIIYENMVSIKDDPNGNKKFNEAQSTASNPIDISDITNSERGVYLRQASTNAQLKIRVYADSDEDWDTTECEYYLGYKIGNDFNIERWGGEWLDEDAGDQWADVGGPKYVPWDKLDNGKVYYYGKTDHECLGDMCFWTKKHEFTLSFTDSIGPDQIGIAPAATTNYKKGDKVKFSVVFDELISNYSNVTVDTSKFSTYMPINNVTCTGGKGTNVLTFEGTATKDFENGTFSNGSGTNNELMDIKPINGGTIKDIRGNNRAS